MSINCVRTSKDSRVRRLQQAESRGAAETAIEGHRFVAAGSAVRSANEVIGEVAAAGAVLFERLADASAIADLELLRAENAVEHVDDLRLGRVVGVAQDPHELAEDDRPEDAPLAARDGAVDDRFRLSGLGRIVLGEVSHEHVGIEPDHDREAAFRMTAFIRLMLTLRRPRRRSSPRSACTSAWPARTRMSPCLSTMNSTVSPAVTFNRSRTIFGSVIWPFVVRVDVAIPYLVWSSLLHVV